MIEEKSAVLSRYPGAVATWAEMREVNRKGWVIRRHSHDWFAYDLLGGGRTEAEAWRDAWSRIDRAERAMCG